MQSVISRAAVRSFAGLVKALVLPSQCPTVSEVPEWAEDRKVIEVLTYGDGSGFEVAFRGRVWVIGHSLKCPAFGQTV
ncbi:MAG: hypothetical protein KF909_03215 [Rhodocyclaceae bacterium]|nr:hypothetical protein [Rhodocyclaceae bacterium]MCW5616250.1 hypothetical protein [Rhodocyclaceae bacterium]